MVILFWNLSLLIINWPEPVWKAPFQTDGPVYFHYRAMQTFAPHRLHCRRCTSKSHRLIFARLWGELCRFRRRRVDLWRWPICRRLWSKWTKARDRPPSYDKRNSYFDPRRFYAVPESRRWKEELWRVEIQRPRSNLLTSVTQTLAWFIIQGYIQVRCSSDGQIEQITQRKNLKTVI